MSALKVRVYRILKKIYRSVYKIVQHTLHMSSKKARPCSFNNKSSLSFNCSCQWTSPESTKKCVYFFMTRKHTLWCLKVIYPLLNVYSSWHLFGGRGNPPPKKNYNSLNGWQLVCCESIFRPGTELQIYHEKILLMDNKHAKLFVIKQPEGSDVKSRSWSWSWVLTRCGLGLGLGLEPCGLVNNVIPANS